MQFRQIHIEITNVCNRACSFCPGTARPQTFMSVDNFRTIAAQSAPMCDRIYLHVMGEPLLHPDLSSILEESSNLSLPVNVTTNGSLLHTPAGRALLHPIVAQVNISLHGVEDNPDHAAAEIELDQILTFVTEAMAVRPDLYINLRFWNFAGDGREAAAVDNGWIKESIQQKFGIAIPDLQFSSWRKSRRLTGRLYLHLDSRFVWPSSHIRCDNGLVKGSCHGLIQQCGILCDGTVVPCCLDGEGAVPLGNCLETPLVDILHNERAKKIRDGFSRGIVVEDLCKGCGFRNRFSKKV